MQCCSQMVSILRLYLDKNGAKARRPSLQSNFYCVYTSLSQVLRASRHMANFVRLSEFDERSNWTRKNLYCWKPEHVVITPVLWRNIDTSMLQEGMLSLRDNFEDEK